MAVAKDGDKVKVHYTGKLDDGTEFDSSSGREPLEFTLGNQEVIPGFEEAIVGMAPGDLKTVTIAADDAYGPYYKEMVAIADRRNFPEDLTPEVGQQLQVQSEDGDSMVVTVTEVTDERVTLDGNHPLAGKALTFDLELVGIA